MKDVNAHIDHIVGWIQDYFVKNGEGCKAVIGISGGKDSTIAAALLVRALGADRVVAVKMPCGTQHDIADSNKVIEALGIEHVYEINIENIVNATYNAIGYYECENCSQITTNTPARIRMSILYAVAAMTHGRVCNNSNYSECYVGYSTKYGDGAGDFSPLHEYTVTELLEIGDALTEIPTELIHKAPEDGMCGKTDEDNLGFSYAVLDDWILNEVRPDQKTYEKIERMARRATHKQRFMPTCRKLREDNEPFCF